MAIVVTEISAAGGTSSSAVNVAGITAAVPVGDVVVVVWAGATGAATSVTDTKGNTYTLAKNEAGDTAKPCTVFYAVVTAALTTSDTITVNLSAASTRRNVKAWKVSGLSASPFDQVASGFNTTAATSWTAGTTPATTQADEIVFAFFSSNAAASGAGSGFTLLTGRTVGTTPTVALSGEYKVVAATGTQAPAITGPSSQWNGVTVTLKAYVPTTHYGASSLAVTFGKAVAGDVTTPALAPVAAFSADTTSGEAPYWVEFTDLSTNTPTSWDWDFGDGSSIVHLQNPAHEYTVAGTYTVTLTAHNAGGSDSEAKAGFVTITSPGVDPDPDPDPPPAPGPGIRLAPDDSALIADPSWERIDLVYNVQSWTIDRGRQNEMSRTDTGTASIELVDRTGDFDPTNPAGAFSNLAPMAQAAISLQNPVTDEWSTLFRGFVAAVRWMPYASEQHANVTLDLVDGLAFLAACEMAPDGSFGDSVDDGNVVFDEDIATDAVQTRIRKALDDAKWPGSLRSIFTGNVKLQETRYAPRSTVLSVIQDAADAEFPEQSNVYVGGPKNPGQVVFHGRYARFHPDVTQYHIRTWQAGDDAAAQASPSTVVRISPPLVASLDDTLLFTSALATPQNIDDGDIAAQYVTNDPAVDANGLRTWSAENLATFGGAGATTANAETRLFADYVRDNYSTPRVRVGQLTVKSRRPDSVYAAATWELLCEIDISDIVHLQTTHGGGGGFDTDFYVEGIHYTARPGGGVPYVELTLDVSPRGYYDSNPFE